MNLHWPDRERVEQVCAAALIGGAATAFAFFTLTLIPYAIGWFGPGFLRDCFGIGLWYGVVAGAVLLQRVRHPVALALGWAVVPAAYATWAVIDEFRQPVPDDQAHLQLLLIVFAAAGGALSGVVARLGWSAWLRRRPPEA